MAITQIIATLPAVLNDSETFYEDIAIRNNSLVTVSFPSINTWATQANALAVEINDKAAQVAAQAVDGGYSQDYINDNFFSQTYISTNFVGVNNAQTIAGIKTFIASPIVPTPTTGTQVANKDYVDDTSILNLSAKVDKAKDTSGDIDLLLTGGIYAYTTSLTNLPTGAGVAGSLLVSQGIGTTARSQLLISLNGNMFFRYGDGGGWLTWERVVSNSDFIQSLATEGYQKLPSGLILQWGVTATASSGTETFPIAFPNACFVVQIANNSSNSTGYVSTFSKTYFSWSNLNTVVNRYFAIGY